MQKFHSYQEDPLLIHWSVFNLYFLLLYWLFRIFSYDYRTLQKTDFSRAQTLGFKDGIPTAKLDYPSIGGDFQHTIDTKFSAPQERGDFPTTFSTSWTRKHLEFSTVGQPSLAARGITTVAANGTLPTESETVPPFIAYDKLVLCFNAYFKGFLFTILFS